MKVTKKIEKEIEQVMDDYWSSYFNGDLQSWASFLPDDYRNIGSTKAEIWNSKKEIVDFTEGIIDQTVGMAEIRNKKTQIIPYDPYIMVHELGDLFVKAEEGWVFYAPFRLSSLLEKTTDGWKILHQHGSYPDSKTEDGEAFGFDELKAENKKLHDAIKSRTIELEHKNRELEIEAALERIRAKTMAMQHSDELGATSLLLFDELKALGEISEQISIGIFDEEKQVLNLYATVYGEQWKETGKVDLDEPFVMQKIYSAWGQKKKSIKIDLSGKELKAYNQFRSQFSNLKFPEKRWVIHGAFFSKGVLTFSTTTPHDDQTMQLLERFAQVFDGTYTRFLDLQKAEAQAREAQIEAAVERVRAEAMAMHSTSDFEKVTQQLLKQTQLLELDGFTGASIGMIDEKEFFTWWDFSSPGSFSDPKSQISRYDAHQYYHLGTKVLNRWKEGENYMVFEYDLKMLHEAVKEWEDINPTIADDFKEAISGGHLTHQWNPCGRLANGLLAFDMVKLPDDDVRNITTKMTHAFEQAYIRFLDLQKAEAQAREAQIEAALERVRSRTMAMHKSSELSEAAILLFEQIENLGIETFASGFNIWDEAHENLISWMSNATGSIQPPFELPIHAYGQHKKIYKAWKKKEVFLVHDIKGKALEKHYQFLRSFPLLDESFQEAEAAGIKIPDRQVHNIVTFSHGYLLFITIEPKPEFQDIFQRFGQVFEQTYTRFLDLKKAEAQARESQIEAALERVRSRTMAMQRSDELKEASAVLIQQVLALGIPAFSCGYNIFEKDAEECTAWMSTPDGSINPAINIPLTEDPNFIRFTESKKQGKEFYVLEMRGADMQRHYQYLSDAIPVFAETFNAIRASGQSLPKTQIHHIVNFTYGNLMFITLDPCPEAHDIFKRFGKVFEQTYTRFLDLQKAEAQAREAEIEAALEKIRSRSLAVNKSDEFIEVVRVVFEKLSDLDIPVGSVTIALTKNGTKDLEVYGCGEGDSGLSLIKFNLPYFSNAFSDDILAAQSSAESGYFSKVYSEAEKNEYYKFAFKNTELKNLPDDLKENVWQSKSYALSVAYTKNSIIMVNEFEGQVLNDDQANILKRISLVFEQSYIRFLDLQRSEAQAREAQIETALERVRSRSLAMHKASELGEVITVIVEQLRGLDFPVDDGVALITYIEGSKDLIEWMENPGFPTAIKFHLPYFDHPVLSDLWKAKESGADFIVTNYSAEDSKSFLNHIFKHSDFVHTPQEIKDYCLAADSYGYTIAFQNNTSIFINDYSGYRLTEDEIDILKRFSKVFEQAYTRFLDLQKAEAQAREAQIEAALERTRTQSMLMQHSGELDRTIKVFHEQLHLLGIASEFSYLWLPDEEESTHLFWATWFETKIKKDGKLEVLSSMKTKSIVYPLDKTEPSIAECYVAWESGKTIHVNPIAPDGVKEYFDSWPELLSGAEHFKLEYFPKGIYYIDAYMKYGCFGIMIRELLSEDEKNILSRFTKEFERTYTRFLDLQKAETQAREAQIEVALERVRSRAIAMRHSDELSEAAELLYQEFFKLGVESFSCGYLINDDEEMVWKVYMTNPGEPFFKDFWTVPMEGDDSLNSRYKSWKRKEEFHCAVLEGEANRKHHEFIAQYAPWKADIIDSLPPKLVFNSAHFSLGHLLVITPENLNTDLEEALVRFASVFDLAYRRFIDLQKAEAQAREAQIEVALERVRAKAMAMQKPEELVAVATLLRQEMGLLGVEELETSSIYIYDDTNGKTECWYSIQDRENESNLIADNMTIDLNDTWVGQQMLSFYNSEQHSTSIVMQGANRKEWITYCAEKSNLFSVEGFYGEVIPERTYHLYKFNNGYMGAAAPGDISAESWDLLRRATAVFSLAYTRFSDLQIAEAQAREAQIEAALEKVRSRTMAMHSPDELQEVVAIVAEKLQDLGVILDANGVILCTYFEDSRDVMHWISAPDFSGSGKYLLPYFDHPIFSAAWESRLSGAEYFSKSFPVEEKNSFFEYAFEYSDYKHFPEDFKEWVFQNDKHSLSFAWSKNSAILIPSHTGVVPNETDIDILKRFAKVFEQAYIRFMDLQTKEEQAAKILEEKQRLEETLRDLQATQKQLIQSEKMASLGELTAGIAHEIQNPLNFVNNFSEVSRELVEEMREELENGDLEEAKAISNDIQQNLEKINHHGNRADAIVKGMLQHSRKNTGEKTSTDINQLSDEYLRLAYHGLRAKDKSFNATLNTHFDPSLEKVMMIPQDMGRVLLNLVNNAFYAINEKKRTGDNGYQPTVTIRTKRADEHITIAVEDNGNGIPQQVIDKVFQPFFTTKPTGQGTGLGLSLSYDIIKAHGGTMEIDTEEGLGTTFTIVIPNNV